MSESVDDEIRRLREMAVDANRIMEDQSRILGESTAVIENFDLGVKCFGTASAEVGNKHGVGDLRMVFDGFIYQKYGNVVQVVVRDKTGSAMVFLDPDDLLRAAEWMRRVYPVEKTTSP